MKGMTVKSLKTGLKTSINTLTVIATCRWHRFCDVISDNVFGKYVGWDMWVGRCTQGCKQHGWL